MRHNSLAVFQPLLSIYAPEEKLITPQHIS